MRIFGHPVHPMLVHFPIAFWTLATVAYAATMLSFAGPTHVIAVFANVVALVMTLPAAVAGLMEWRSIAEGSKALRVASLHMMIMLSAWTMFVVALILPMLATLSTSARSVGAGICAFIGFGLLSAGGWLGGRLVYEFGVGKVMGQSN